MAIKNPGLHCTPTPGCISLMVKKEEFHTYSALTGSLSVLVNSGKLILMLS